MLPVTLYVYADLNADPVLETSDLEAAIRRAHEEFVRTGNRAWVLDAAKDIYAHVDASGVAWF